jgi:hypothetical protein
MRGGIRLHGDKTALAVYRGRKISRYDAWSGPHYDGQFYRCQGVHRWQHNGYRKGDIE